MKHDFDDVIEAIQRRAFGRLRLKLCFETHSRFRQLVEYLAGHILQDAAALAAIGVDITSRDGFRRLHAIAERRLLYRQHQAAVFLMSARPAIRKAIFAAAFAWLRLRFPVLNAPAAVVAARTLYTILQHRKT